MKVKCGDASGGGNIAMSYKGGCGEELDIKDAYRCVGCGGWFHLDCILKHFQEEEGHDVARYNLKKIKEYIGDRDRNITDLCDKGLAKQKQLTPGEQLINFINNIK